MITAKNIKLISCLNGQLKLHVALMSAAFLFVLAGMVLSIMGQHGWQSQKSNFHSYGGHACVVVMFLLMISGLGVNEKAPGLFNTYNMCHAVVGHVIYLASCEIPKTHRQFKI